MNYYDENTLHLIDENGKPIFDPECAKCCGKPLEL